MVAKPEAVDPKQRLKKTGTNRHALKIGTQKNASHGMWAAEARGREIHGSRPNQTNSRQARVKNTVGRAEILERACEAPGGRRVVQRRSERNLRGHTAAGPLQGRVVPEEAADDSVDERTALDRDVPRHAGDGLECRGIVERCVRRDALLRHLVRLAERAFVGVVGKCAHDLKRARAVPVEVTERFDRERLKT